MDITILDKDFKAVGLIDTFKSAIWTDRYSSAGDFEVYTTASSELIDLFLKNQYAQSTASETTMVIDGIELSSNPESGDELKLVGRSLVSILDRRIILGRVSFSGNIQDGVKQLLNENIINPADPKRKIPNFIFVDSTDKRILDINVSFEVYGDNLYDFIKSLCSEKKVGFKITLSDKNEFLFSLYMGIDRSYNQSVLPPVIFSPKFDNIVSSNYVRSRNNYKNVSIVSVSSGDTYKTITVTRPGSSDSGLDRYEIFTSGDSNKKDAELKQLGLEDLNRNKGEDLFEGEVDSIHTYQYGNDFFIGDVIQMENSYGMSSQTRVTEFVINESDAGVETYPSFEVVE